MDDQHDLRRRDTWTWTKEILGTIVGVVLAMAVPLGYVSTWMRDIEKAQSDTRLIVAVHTKELDHLKEQRVEISGQLKELNSKLDQLIQRSTR